MVWSKTGCLFCETLRPFVRPNFHFLLLIVFSNELKNHGINMQNHVGNLSEVIVSGNGSNNFETVSTRQG